MKKNLWLIITLFVLKSSLLSAQVVNQPIINANISGTVRDHKTHLLLEGATVKIKGTTNQSLTNNNGAFNLKTGQKIPLILQVSYIGYITLEVEAEKSEINIELFPEENNLNEVVITGYGTQKRLNVTGAVSVLKMNDIAGSRSETDIAHLLQGASPGLQVNYESGEPGAATTLKIRGTTSINGGAPLVLLDNVPIASLSLINPSDIESVTVLKDAGSAAIYGARSAWGVILLATKKGNKNQPTRFEYGNNIVLNNAQDIPKGASPTELVKAYGDIGFSSFWTGQDINTWATLLSNYSKDPSQYPSGFFHDSLNSIDYPLQETNVWKDMLSPAGFQQNHNFSVSGGSTKTAYRLSAGVTNEDGILITNKDSYKRYNLSSFVTTDVNPWLTFQLTALYNNSLKSFPYSNIAEYGIFSDAAVSPSYTQLGSSIVDGVSVPVFTPRNAIEQSSPATTDISNTKAFRAHHF